MPFINTSLMASHLKSGMTQTARVSSWRRISEDVIPPRTKNLWTIVALTYCIPTAIFSEAAISFVCVGIHPPQPNWGKMVTEDVNQGHIATGPRLLFSLSWPSIRGCSGSHSSAMGLEMPLIRRGIGTRNYPDGCHRDCLSRSIASAFEPDPPMRRHSIDLKCQAKGGQQSPPLAVHMVGGHLCHPQHEFLDCPFRGSQEGARAWESEWTINFAFLDSDSRVLA